MLKIRLQGTANDIRWIKDLLEQNERVEILDFSDLYSNKGTKRFFRAYSEIENKYFNRFEIEKIFYKEEKEDKDILIRKEIWIEKYIQNNCIYPHQFEIH